MADIEKLKRNLAANGFVTSHFATAAEAADHICGQIEGEHVAFGGSKTLDDMGLYERLSEKNTVTWHWKTDEKPAALKKAMEAQVYLSSANAVAETGEIVNIDGHCNRVSASVYGHKQVYFVFGKNNPAPYACTSRFGRTVIQSKMYCRQPPLSSGVIC